MVAVLIGCHGLELRFRWKLDLEVCIQELLIDIFNALVHVLLGIQMSHAEYLGILLCLFNYLVNF